MNKNNAILDSQEASILSHEYFKTKSIQTRNELAEICEPTIRYYIKYLINNYKIPDGINEDDLYGDAAIGLIYGIETFDPNKGSTFKSWILTNIWAAIIDYIRKNSFGGKYLYKEYKLIYMNDQQFDSIQDIYADKLFNVINARIDLISLLNKAVKENRISTKMKFIFINRFILGLSPDTIAKITGLAYNSVIGYSFHAKKELMALARKESTKCQEGCKYE